MASVASEGTTVKGIPSSLSSEWRLGDCDAKKSWKSGGNFNYLAVKLPALGEVDGYLTFGTLRAVGAVHQV